MRLLKSHPILGLLNSYMVDSPQPSSISYMWNFGSLLGACLVIQIVTGITLAMHYTPNIDLAFVSVEHIMRDVHYGWLIRYLHANVASFFFIFLYLHIGRGLYYGSYRSPRILLWSVGVIILVLMIVTGFLGLWQAQNKEILFFDISFLWIVPLEATICSNRLSNILNKYEKLNVLAVWENLDRPDIKKLIYPKIKSIAGIYIIINKVNGKMYVGSAILGKMPNRFHKHFTGTGSKPLWLAIQKYGLSNFAFLVIDIIKNYSSDLNKLLLDKETTYIAAYGDYNLTKFADNTLGYKHTELTRELMKANYSLARREAIGSLNRSKLFSEKTIKFMRESALKRSPMPASVRLKISVNSPKAQFYQLSLIGQLKDENNFIVLRTILVVAKYCDCSEKTIRRALKGNGIVRGKWTIKSLGVNNKISL